MPSSGVVSWGVGAVAAVSGEFRREVAALAEVFAFLEEFAGGHRVDERTTFCIKLVVEELFTNMVRHNRGGGATITVSIEHRDNYLNLELVDTDVEPFDPASVKVPPVHAGIEDRRPGGLGIYLVKTMVDVLNYDYETEGRKMRIKVTKKLEN
jgi:serine/threonine-protein kinase RsbW